MFAQLKTVFWLQVAVTWMAVIVFLTRVGRLPESAGEWGRLAFGSVLLLGIAFTVGAMRASLKQGGR